MTEHQPVVLDLDTDDAANRPGTRLWNLALREALAHGARRVRLMPGPEFGLVEFEIGGAWKTEMKVPAKAHEVMVAHLRALAGVDAAGQGALQIRFNSRSLTAAVSGPQQPNGTFMLVALGPAT